MSKQTDKSSWKERMPFYEEGTYPEASDVQSLDYFETLEEVWGNDWGAQGIGELKHVMLPTITDDCYGDPAFREDPTWFVLDDGIPDEKKLQEEVHDQLEGILKNEGIKVDHVKPSDWPEMYEEGKGYQGPYGTIKNFWAVGEAWVVNGGAINSRSSMSPWRIGREIWFQKALSRIGCPILHTVGHSGTGCLEVGQVVLDEEHIMLPVGMGGNMEGIEEVKHTLKRAGYKEIIPVPIPGFESEDRKPSEWLHQLHVSCVFGVADLGLAVYDPLSFPYALKQYLEEQKGMTLLEVPREEALDHACNSIVVEPGKIITPEGNPVTRRKLENHGVEVITVRMDEIKKAGGTAHCMIGRLVRDDGPTLTELDQGPSQAQVNSTPLVNTEW